MNLTKENYKIIAAKLYRNPILIDNEFTQDLILLNRVVNRVKKFSDSGELKVKMLFNHYKVACNCFGTEYVNKVIFLLSDSTMHALLMTVLWSFSGNIEDVVVNEKLTIRYDPSCILTTVADKIKTGIRE